MGVSSLKINYYYYYYYYYCPGSQALPTLYVSGLQTLPIGVRQESHRSSYLPDLPLRLSVRRLPWHPLSSHGFLRVHHVMLILSSSV